MVFINEKSLFVLEKGKEYSLKATDKGIEIYKKSEAREKLKKYMKETPIKENKKSGKKQKSADKKYISDLIEGYDFENYVVGECNRFPHKAALNVAESPADAYNPLFIYGNDGMGKTHLINAIGHFIEEKNPDLRITYTTAEKFRGELSKAIEATGYSDKLQRDDFSVIEGFREKYRTTDVLLFDDFEFLAGNESDQKEAQTEFFHTFNQLYMEHKQIVVASSKPPREIIGLEKRLVERLEGGLIADIKPPSLETKIIILRRLAKKDGIEMPDEVCHYISSKSQKSVNELKAVYSNIASYSKLTKTEINLDTAEQVLKACIEEESKGEKPGFSKIVERLDTLKKRLGPILEGSLDEQTKKDEYLKKRLAEEKKKIDEEWKRLGKEQTKSESPKKGADKQKNLMCELMPDYTFLNYVVGASNRFTHAVALAVAESPADAYNPVYIYGSDGLGKTHLLNAIGNYIQEADFEKKIVFTNAENFCNELVNAMRCDKIGEFRNKYRKADVLLMDDLEFLEGKESVQEELFHTFNDLYKNHKQIVVASDRPPKEIAGLEERLRSRFESGLVTDVNPPSLETKIIILGRLAKKDGIEIPDEVCHYISSKSPKSVNELKAVYSNIASYSKLTKTEINLDMAEEILKNYTEIENLTNIQESIGDLKERLVSEKDPNLDFLLNKEKNINEKLEKLKKGAGYKNSGCDGIALEKS